MPVYDLSYKTLGGPRRGPLFRLLAIPKYAYMELLSRKIFIWLFTMAWLQFFLRLAYIYLLVNSEFLLLLDIPLTKLPTVGPLFFKTMIDIQFGFCFALAFLLGAGIISRDLSHNAMVLFMSKPIGRWEYFLGKFLTVFPLFIILTWLQTALLFAIQFFVSPEQSLWRLYFWEEYAWILPAAASYSIAVSVTLTMMVLAASSLTRNKRHDGTILFVYLFGASGIAAIVSDILKDPNLMALSPVHAAVEFGLYMFLDHNYGMSLNTATLGLIGPCLLCGLILYWRISRGARLER